MLGGVSDVDHGRPFLPNKLVSRNLSSRWEKLNFLLQLRLRHLYQIMGLNLTSAKKGTFYYTLHLTSMCAPFYTSEKVDGSNVKWAELDIKNLPSLSVSGESFFISLPTIAYKFYIGIINKIVLSNILKRLR